MEATAIVCSPLQLSDEVTQVRDVAVALTEELHTLSGDVVSTMKMQQVLKDGLLQQLNSQQMVR